MRDVAVIAFAQSPCQPANRHDDMAEILLPVIQEALSQAGVERDRVDFYASGSHDFFEGRTFSYIESLDAVGAWPPISESHVEMDAAWAFAEAWTWLQLGEGDISLVYGVGRGSLATDLDQVLPTQLDPYLLTPLRPHRDALAGLQAAALLDAGLLTERAMAETVQRCLGDATTNSAALKAAHHTLDELLSAPYVARPLRTHDVGPTGDGAAAVVLAAGNIARELSERPAWVRGLDHRIETHYPGMRTLTESVSTRTAAHRAAELAGFAAMDVDVAELHTEYSYQESLLTTALNLKDADINPSGGPLAGRPMTATGLIRIGEVAQRILDGRGDRGLAHATNGPILQHNLVCLMEGE
ncbi:lipid-transfer protein [Hoyosella sp. YIM 151337]|uniref:lipid-transfer protein n=1 Tax=Hoyosella sp. YIM 151337 TaxID=2992742 RepID=UPI002235D0B3|nr:lipid-transfer protein [Hoyosella sp. YIM 151337]MCW4354996.1 lipid-transfer protein [Hoyosella sp. YIM 151337]